MIVTVPSFSKRMPPCSFAGGAVHSRKLPTPMPRSRPRAFASARRASKEENSAASSAFSSTSEKAPLSYTLPLAAL